MLVKLFIALLFIIFFQSNQNPGFSVLTHSRPLLTLWLKNWAKYTWYRIYLLMFSRIIYLSGWSLLMFLYEDLFVTATLLLSFTVLIAT